MTGKQKSGILGIVVGLVWLMFNLRHVPSQGLVAIGMPLLLLAVGTYYVVKGKSE